MSSGSLGLNRKDSRKVSEKVHRKHDRPEQCVHAAPNIAWHRCPSEQCAPLSTTQRWQTLNDYAVRRLAGFRAATSAAGLSLLIALQKTRANQHRCRAAALYGHDPSTMPRSFTRFRKRPLRLPQSDPIPPAVRQGEDCDYQMKSRLTCQMYAVLAVT